MRTSFAAGSRASWTALVIGAGALAAIYVTGFDEAQGQQAVAPQFADRPTFADVFEQVNPAVVTVSVTMQNVAWNGQQGNPLAGTPFEGFEEFFYQFGGPNQAPVMPQPRQGVGSGFIIDPDGYIATNNHVVEGAAAVMVTLASGEELQARVVGTDPRTDLALIKVDNGGSLPAVRFGDSDSARVGEWVLAIGNPFGLGGTATAGIVSARGRDLHTGGGYDDFLQIDAAINSGNSGGPVFNASGEVIGINTAIFSPTGGSVGIGFAIPSAQAREIFEDLRDDGTVSRGWLGIAMAEDENGDVVVAEVTDGGPAAAAGLVAGDVVTSLDGEPIDSTRTLAWLVGTRDAGDEVAVEVRRDGDVREFRVELGNLDESQAQANTFLPQTVPPQKRQPRVAPPFEQYFKR